MAYGQSDQASNRAEHRRCNQDNNSHLEFAWAVFCGGKLIKEFVARVFHFCTHRFWVCPLMYKSCATGWIGLSHGQAHTF
jgi:hypothetical protein